MATLLHKPKTKLAALLFIFGSSALAISFLHKKHEFLFPTLTFIFSLGGYVLTRPQLEIGKTEKASKNKTSYKLSIENKTFSPAKNCKLKISFELNDKKRIEVSNGIIKDENEYPNVGIINDPILWDEYIDKDGNRSTTYNLGGFDSATAELFSWKSEKPVIEIASEKDNTPRIVLGRGVDIAIHILLTGDNFISLEKTCKITNKNGKAPTMELANK